MEVINVEIPKNDSRESNMLEHSNDDVFRFREKVKNVEEILRNRCEKQVKRKEFCWKLYKHVEFGEIIIIDVTSSLHIECDI